SAPSALGSGFLGKARFLVVDEKGFPVSGASVAIISKDSNQIIAGLESDFSGRVNSDFEFSSGKEYSVRASKVGYLNSTIDWNPASATEIAKIVLPVDQNYKIQQAIRYPKNIPRVVTTVPSGIPERAVNPAETAMQIASASVTGIDFSKSVPKPVIENGRQKYEFEVWKTGKLFFLIDVSVPAGKIIVDPETGEVERAGVPWYASLISG
ncbi:MAG: carboxypeptidase-like regulatory domain-containing protein, partial [archaeon]